MRQFGNDVEIENYSLRQGEVIMTRKYLPLYIALLTALAGFSVTGFASEREQSAYTDRAATMWHRPLTGAEELPGAASTAARNLGAVRSPGIMIGETQYDYQQNGSMGRQVVYTFEGTDQYCGVHFVWMCLPCPGSSPPTYRHIRYNSVDCQGNWSWPIGPEGGKAIEYANGGYCSIDVTHYGAAVPSFHYGAEVDSFHAYVFQDINPPLGFWIDCMNPGPAESDPVPNCQQIYTDGMEMGGQYIWSKVEFDVCGDDSVFHKVCLELPPPYSGPAHTLVYYRDVWYPDIWTIVPPMCGTVIDSVHCLDAVVRQDPTSDEIAIVWGHPIHPQPDANDPCGFTQWQNDVYVWYSTDCGVTWDPANRYNVTDYTDGGALSIDEVPYLHYTDLSALYDHDGVLHVVWSTPLRDECQPLYASRVWHWDDSPSGGISIVYDASRPGYFRDCGAWNNSTCKMNISECYADDTTRLYVQFTRFGAHTTADGDSSADYSAGGYENGDIFLVGSSDAGRSWGEAVNLTNTFTPGCAPGECASEHWSSMAKYSIDSLHIQYILDLDAGGIPHDESEMTCNPVMYLKHECFAPEPYCNLAWQTTPDVSGYPYYLWLEQESCPYNNWPTTKNFDLVMTNTGNIPVAYTVTPDVGWLAWAGGDPASGVIQPGYDNTATLTYAAGPFDDQGLYEGTLTMTACSGEIESTVQIAAHVDCQPIPNQPAILTTACWSVGVWNVPRAGTAEWHDPEGNMYWYPSYIPPDGAPFMYDGSVVVTYAQDTSQTWFSIFEGSDDGVEFTPSTALTTTAYETYEYAQAGWSNAEWDADDTVVKGEIEYFVPLHPDTCVLIERVTICNNSDTAITLHIGEAVDWDIPDDAGGLNNDCGANADERVVYQKGTPDGSPESDYYGAASFCHNIPGAIVLGNPTWVFPNSGYRPAEIGGLLARHGGFEADCDSAQDYSSVYVVAQNVFIEPDSCIVYCMVKTSSITGLDNLYDLIAKGKRWITENGLDCPQYIVCDCIPGDASHSWPPPWPPWDIDDVVYMIAYIFSGGSPPLDYAICSGDPNCSCGVDIDDIVYMIAYIFSGGPEPCTCEHWAASCGPLQ